MRLEALIEDSITQARKTSPEEEAYHEASHEADINMDDKNKSGSHLGTGEKGFGRAVGTTRLALDLVQNLTPVFTTDVLTDPTTLKMILKYAEANNVPHGADMLRFWVEIDELQHLPSHSYTHRRLRKIYDKFLSPEAPSPVCVTIQMLHDIEKALEGDNISAGIYALAQQICFVALEKSVYPRFRESKLFRKMQDFCAPAIPNAGSSSAAGSSGSGPTLLQVASATGTVAANITEGTEEAEDFSLLGILAHPAKLRFLKTFCMEALALENLLFYLEVEDCKRLPNLSFVVNKTRKIYDRYCAPSSKNFLACLDENGALREIQNVVESKGALIPKLFYEVQLSVFNRISEDIWPGFCRSKDYLDHSREIKPDTKQLMRRANRFEQTEALNQKLDGLAEVQLIDAAMHYPVEKLIPFESINTSVNSVGGSSQRTSIKKFEDDQIFTPQQQLSLLLSDPFAKKYFKMFMTRRGVDSLLAFCEEVEDFKLLPGIEFLQHSAKKIYRKYMMPSARLQVDMSANMRDEIYVRLANPSVDMFKKIATRVRHGMLQDSLPRFVKSNYYKDLRRASKQTPADVHLATVDQAAKAGKLELCHLDVFLTYPGCMQAFRKFLDFQHCSENLMLWEEIEHYRRLPSYQIVLRSAKKIYDKYLNPSNPRSPIPLEPALRKRVELQLEVACRTTFDEVENECYDHMRNVIVPDFLDSRIFMALVGTWATVHDDYPAEMLRGELEMAFLRHRFHLVQEARGMSRDSPAAPNEKQQRGVVLGPGGGANSG
ncbi:hypothetical protein BBI17_001159 [Phytophthora kernoviae]|uniref:RGS domain-containing protein n=2 Tax=Phytophthora kernoviae TaxID=325452 RepID=A0A421EY81_9STRA|nr:hypothetical protein G195_002339 [Phytophthora kernoviae 00238/432]KAG2530797.1 hypothetical protein JM18_001184 [Phytophthora kernoviae]RLN10301.1 hypothetical protein BBI17_001159 [Phytophthora kernoviae]